MAEVYKNSNDIVRTKVFWRNELVDPGSNVVVVIYDITNDPKVSPPINPNTPVAIITAAEDDIDPGSYHISMPFNLTTRNRKFKLTWQVTMSGQTEFLTTYCDVVTPYASIAEVVEDLGLGSDPSDPLYKDYHELKMAEKYARKQVEYYTGQKFYLYDEVFTVMGNDSDILPLPSKIYQLHTLHQNDQLWINNLTNVNYLGYVIEPTTSGFGIKINQATLLDSSTYIANGLVPPSIHDGTPNIFRRGNHYDVSARFGWSSVPDDVEQATIEIMRSYFAKDRAWRDRYVKKISTTDWDFEFQADAFSGTGSAYADKLLADYIVTQMLVV